ncbi:probable nucleoside diphosphate kinase 5 isoform X2 [Telopea speciosissima]|nr:probable nucleoside diphosphate kinase 5 isoform X2 [Telopea speciosissima]
MIKPDGFSGNYTAEIKRVILKSGFNILNEKIVHLDEENVTVFYAEHSKRTFFPNLVKYMTSGPVVVMVLEKVGAISDWRALIGPTDAQKAKITHPDSIRALCGLNSERNCVHGSDSPHSATREISFFFGEMFSSGESIANHDEL